MASGSSPSLHILSCSVATRGKQGAHCHMNTDWGVGQVTPSGGVCHRDAQCEEVWRRVDVVGF